MRGLSTLIEKCHRAPSRRVGKTTMAAALARKVDGILVCATGKIAKNNTMEFGVDTIGVDDNLDRLRGHDRPIILDQDAALAIIGQLHNQVQVLLQNQKGLEALNGELNDQLDKAKAISQLRGNVNDRLTTQLNSIPELVRKLFT